MKNRFFTFISTLLIAVLSISPAAAGGAVKLSGAAFKLGSLISSGTATGLGNTDWIILLDAQGHADVVCTNKGGNAAPGQNYPHIQRSGSQLLAGNSQLRKNGKSPFNVETQKETPANTVIDPVVAGCPNSNWTAKIVFVFWDQATIYAVDPATNTVAATYKYNCVTVKTGPNSTPSTFDDGTVSCTPQ